MKRTFDKNITNWKTTNWIDDLSNRDNAIKQNLLKYQHNRSIESESNILNQVLVSIAVALTVILIALIQYV